LLEGALWIAPRSALRLEQLAVLFCFQQATDRPVVVTIIGTDGMRRGTRLLETLGHHQGNVLAIIIDTIIFEGQAHFTDDVLMRHAIGRAVKPRKIIM